MHAFKKFIRAHDVTIQVVGLFLTVMTAGLALPVMFLPAMIGDED